MIFSTLLIFLKIIMFLNCSWIFFFQKLLATLQEVYLLDPKRQLTCVLPFFDKRSLQLRPRLVSSVNKTIFCFVLFFCCFFCNLKVVFGSQHKLNTLFGFKGTLTRKIHSLLVYRYTCSNYNDTYYVKIYHYFFH